MKRFIVTCTMIHNGIMFVDAENSFEALDIAQNKLYENVDCINWDFGEATADYAEEEVILDGDVEEDNPTTPQPKYKVGDVLISNDNIEVNFAIVGITDDGEYECSDGEYEKIDDLDYSEEYHLAEDWELKIINEVKVEYPKYNVGDYLISIDSIKRYGLNSDKLILFQITDIRDGKYITSDDKEDDIEYLDINGDFRLATDEEIKQYYQARHKYNVGDTIGPLSRNGEYEKIIEIENGVYTFESLGAATIESIDNDKDISTKEKEYTFAKTDLMPFDKVLVRDDESCTWIADFFSHIPTDNNGYQYVTCGGVYWEQCIPYNSETAHLIGTTSNYNGKYKTW